MLESTLALIGWGRALFALRSIWRRLNPQRRHVRRSKSLWEVGRDYERYIGYLYERQGWSVSFRGAVAGVHDRGVDLIAQRNGATHLVQCKRWSRDKEIAEDVSFHFFASMVRYAVETGHVERGVDILETLHRARITGVIVTAAKLSPSARDACRLLGVQTRELVAMQRYPMIKCNVGADGRRIYHLPSDPFYDRIRVEPHKGEFYAWSRREAEAHGFRRARRPMKAVVLQFRRV